MDRKKIAGYLWLLTHKLEDYKAGRRSKGRVIEDASYLMMYFLQDEGIEVTDCTPAKFNDLAKGNKK